MFKLITLAFLAVALAMPNAKAQEQEKTDNDTAIVGIVSAALTIAVLSTVVKGISNTSEDSSEDSGTTGSSPQKALRIQVRDEAAAYLAQPEYGPSLFLQHAIESVRQEARIQNSPAFEGRNDFQMAQILLSVTGR